MLLRFACALDAGKFGDSSAGSGAGRGGAPEAGIAKDKKGTDVFNPYPWLLIKGFRGIHVLGYRCVGFEVDLRAWVSAGQV